MTRSSQSTPSLLGENKRRRSIDAQNSSTQNQEPLDIDNDMRSLDDAMTEEDASDSSSDIELEQKSAEPDPHRQSPSDHAEQILQPLQQTADRVSKQVEDFAKKLDRFHSARDEGRHNLWRNASELIQAFETIAITRKSNISAEILRISRSRNKSHSSPQNVEELRTEARRAEKEAELWHLFGDLLALEPSWMQEKFAKTKKASLKQLNHYSTDSEIWESFLSSDIVAHQYQLIIKWLQKSARVSRPSIDELTEPSRQKADQGKGIWSAGWLLTKESIKAQKRSRIWPMPLNPDDPGLETSLRRESDSRRLISQLDPDAKCRQGAVLESADECHEESAWQACWELLRRGMPPADIREWWSERKENWRAVSIGVGQVISLTAERQEWSRFVALWRMNTWAACCFNMCRSGRVACSYEAAVYGLLCGDLQVPMKICQSTDDHLFVHLNTYLVERYRDFGNLVAQPELRPSAEPLPSKHGELRRLVQYCQRHKKMREENRDPLNALQNAIISQDYGHFIVRQGRALARINKYRDQPSDLIFSDDTRDINETAEAVATDSEGLRLVTHLQLVLKAMNILDQLYASHGAILENNVTAYIEWLHQEGKIALIPLYAATLSAERGARVLGSVITDVTEIRDRDMIVSLIKKYDMNVSRVLGYQYQAIAKKAGISTGKGPNTFHPVLITQQVGSGSAKNVKIRTDFIGDDFDSTEELLIRCLEWCRYGDQSAWPQICQVATSIYKSFICRGRLGATRVLCNRASLSSVSKSVLNVELGDPIASDSDNGDEIPDEDSQPGPLRSPSTRRPEASSRHDSPIREKADINHAIVAQQARTWRQLEQLIVALYVLETWIQVAVEFEETKLSADPLSLRNMKKMLQACLNDVCTTIPPLFEPDFLNPSSSISSGSAATTTKQQTSNDDAIELQTLAKFRNHYLPECILAYHSVLYFAGHTLTRQMLVECMNLAQIVATNDNLTRAFVDSGRMQELVTSLALSSSAMLHANEQGGRSSSGGGAAGSTVAGGGTKGSVMETNKVGIKSASKSNRESYLDMWQVRPQDVGLTRDRTVQQILGR